MSQALSSLYQLHANYFQQSANLVCLKPRYWAKHGFWWGKLVSCIVHALVRTVTRGGESPLEKFSTLEKCVGHSVKLFNIFKKIWAPLGKLFAPPGVPSWLRAWRWCSFRSATRLLVSKSTFVTRWSNKLN